LVKRYFDELQIYYTFVQYDERNFSMSININVNWQNLIYVQCHYKFRLHESDLAFLITRHDKQYDLNLGIRYLLLLTLVLTSNLGYTKNTTNYDISDYERTVLTFALRKDFKLVSVKATSFYNLMLFR